MALAMSSILCAAIAGTLAAADPTPPPNPDASSACAAMNISMKIELMHGFGQIDGYSRNSGCGYECGRKTFRWDNGPQGFGDGSPAGKSTQWPSTLNMAASFDPELSGEWGAAMGEEFWAKGTNIQEGPGINIARIENNGRTFEYLSGEDPVLGGVLVQPLIDGIQQHVMAIAKHYILNNQETDRSGVNELVDEKTVMELYAPPFGAAASHAAGYMCSYNRINGVWACENKETLKTILKGYYNFSGFVVSDWGACHSLVDSINGGLDIEMPEGQHFNEEGITAALAAKTITEDQLHESCVRIMSGWYNLPEAKRYPCGGGNCIQNNVSTDDHKALARKISAQSTVLAKNDGGLLPLAKGLTVALIGGDAQSPYVSGQGSGGVPTSNRLVSPLAAFQARGISVTFEPGTTVAAAVAAAKAADVAIVFGSAHSGEGKDRTDLLFSHGRHAAAVTVAAGASDNNCSVTTAGIIGADFFKSDDSAKNAGECCNLCWLHPSCTAYTFAQNNRSHTGSACFLKSNANPQPYKPGRISGTIPGRKPSPSPPPGPPGPPGASLEDIIAAVGAANKRTVVAAVVPGQLLTDWRDSVAAILIAFLPGEQYGNAIADLIFGDAVPQAKLPLSFPKIANEQNMSVHQYPGVSTPDYEYQANYTEGQIVGYRWYDKHNVKPAFPFGHGLTYGGMTYSGMTVTGRTVSFSVAGTGCDTPQLYIGYPTAATDPTVPVKVMRYFKKVCATNADALTTVSYTLTDRDVSNWDVAAKKWAVTPGKYAVSVGSSSQDIRLTSSLTV